MPHYRKFTSQLLLLASLAASAAGTSHYQTAGQYRMEYNDIFYGQASYELTLNHVADTDDGSTEYSLLNFPAIGCNPVQLFIGAGGTEVFIPNNQHSMTDEYGSKQYLQLVDPKLEDDFGNYTMVEDVMLLDRDPETGRISWDGGDFQEGVGWGNFVVVGAYNEGYLCFINRIDMTPLNSTFSGTVTRDGVTEDYAHGCLVEVEGNALRVYGLLQFSFSQPVEFTIDAGTRTLTAVDQILTDDYDVGTLYFTTDVGDRTVSATAEVRDGVTTLQIGAFRGHCEEMFVKTGIVRGQLQIPFDIFDGNSAVTLPTADTAPVQWYNLSGIPVAFPTQPGIYIRRQGSESKVVKF